jgi:hypothetical protein
MLKPYSPKILLPLHVQLLTKHTHTHTHTHTRHTHTYTHTHIYGILKDKKKTQPEKTKYQSHI